VARSPVESDRGSESDPAYPGITMRTTLLIVAFVTLGGCAGTQPAKRPAKDRVGSSHAVPVVLEPPKLSERVRQKRHQEDQLAFEGLTKVQGDLKR
jgi:hypothetical protein